MNSAQRSGLGLLLTVIIGMIVIIATDAKIDAFFLIFIAVMSILGFFILGSEDK